MVYLWHSFVIGARVLAIAMFTVQFQFWLLAVVGYHCLAMIIISSHSQKFAGEQRYLWRFLVNIEMVAINMFCANAGPRNRHYMAVWYIISHCILYTENVVMVVLCYTSTTTPGSWNYVPCMVIIFLGYIVGVIFHIIFYFTSYPKTSDGEETECYVPFTKLNFVDEYAI